MILFASFFVPDAEYGLNPAMESESGTIAPEVAAKRAQKARHAKMPLFWRSLGYFLYRYIVKLGFLDGKEGFLWDYFQGLWYRMLVDGKVYEVRKWIFDNNIDAASIDGKEKIKGYVRTNWNITIKI